jgi:hypothetical protein
MLLADMFEEVARTILQLHEEGDESDEVDLDGDGLRSVVLRRLTQATRLEEQQIKDHARNEHNPGLLRHDVHVLMGLTDAIAGMKLG